MPNMNTGFDCKAIFIEQAKILHSHMTSGSSSKVFTKYPTFPFFYQSYKSGKNYTEMLHSL